MASPTVRYTGRWFSYPSPDEIMAAGTVLPAVGLFIVALRFYTRHKKSAGIGLDDWLILPASAFLEYALLQLMIAAYGFIKISVLCFYRRIFNVDRRAFFNRFTQLFIIVIIIWTVAFYFAYAFVCGTHFSAYWGNVLVSGKYCPYGLKINEGLLISDFITDVGILCVPLPIVRGYIGLIHTLTDHI
ncbi:MAG: hypothetical protein Q9219_002840 [cf. Caloplaca sp. 3 TL-2023]